MVRLQRAWNAPETAVCISPKVKSSGVKRVLTATKCFPVNKTTQHYERKGSQWHQLMGKLLTLWNLLQQHNNSQRWGNKFRTTDAADRFGNWFSSAPLASERFFCKDARSNQRESRPRQQRHPEICRASGCSAGQKVPGARGWEQSWPGSLVECFMAVNIPSVHSWATLTVTMMHWICWSSGSSPQDTVWPSLTTVCNLLALSLVCWGSWVLLVCSLRQFYSSLHGFARESEFGFLKWICVGWTLILSPPPFYIISVFSSSWQSLSSDCHPSGFIARSSVGTDCSSTRKASAPFICPHR